MARDFFEAVSTRRTIYSLGKSSTISDQRLEEILGEAIKHGPSAFNSQSGRIVLLLGKQHDDLWDATRETLRPLVPAPAFPQTEGKLAAFRAGYGTVLFFEDQKIVKELQANYALYKEKFPLVRKLDRHSSIHSLDEPCRRRTGRQPSALRSSHRRVGLQTDGRSRKLEAHRGDAFRQAHRSRRSQGIPSPRRPPQGPTLNNEDRWKLILRVL